MRRHLDVEIIDHIANELKLKQLLLTPTLIFVYSQLFERPSINKMEEWLNQTDILKTLGIERITTAQLYYALDQLQESDFSATETSIAQFFAEYEPDRFLDYYTVLLTCSHQKGCKQSIHDRES